MPSLEVVRNIATAVAAAIALGAFILSWSGLRTQLLQGFLGSSHRGTAHHIEYAK